MVLVRSAWLLCRQVTEFNYFSIVSFSSNNCFSFLVTVYLRVCVCVGVYVSAPVRVCLPLTSQISFNILNTEINHKSRTVVIYLENLASRKADAGNPSLILT